MTKFKVGDRVRVTADSIGQSHRSGLIGQEFVIRSCEGRWAGEVAWGANPSNGYRWKESELELVQPTASPIRTITRREIVPGMYGGVWVGNINARGEVDLKFSGTRNAFGLREAAHLFNQIAEVLEGNAKGDVA